MNIATTDIGNCKSCMVKYNIKHDREIRCPYVLATYFGIVGLFTAKCRPTSFMNVYRQRYICVDCMDKSCVIRVCLSFESILPIED